MMRTLLHSESSTRHGDRSLLEVALVSAVATTTQARSVSLYRVQPAGARLLLERVAHLDADGVRCRDTDFEPPDLSLALEAREEMETCVCNEQAVARRSPSGDASVQCIPVAFDGKVAAVLELHRGEPLEPEELDAAEGIIGLYRNYLSLLEYSERDPLTGLLNRRTLEYQVGKLIASLADGADAAPDGARERREQLAGDSPNWAAVIDVDHFARINSEHGNLYGDEVLILLASLMRESFRHRDRLFRLAGERFVVVLRSAAREDVARALERFRARVADHAFPQVGKVTVSIGYAPILPTDTLSGVLDHAEAAMGRAKADGRNRVVAHQARERS